VIRLLAQWGIVELLDLFPTFCDFAGLRVDFDANGQGHSPPEHGYLEASPHYRVTVTVTVTVAPDFTVRMESSIRS
jgi:hypothetical protein